MKKIVAFAGSNSAQSINKQLVTWAANQAEGIESTVLDLNDFEMPIFSIDREKDSGIHQLAKDFKETLQSADGIMISFAEHNGNVSTAFKNIYDWMSRLGAPIWMNKPMMVMATSPGQRGGKSVLEIVTSSFPRRGAEIASSFSLPSFNENFENSKGISNPELKAEFEEALAKFVKAL
ncbi:MAG: NAD(P)H-dependent oxidoreductase [Cyclobacteriaceae bacterium]